jgi:hypothetical protein
MAPFLADIEVSPRGLETTLSISGFPVEPASFDGGGNIREIMWLATRRVGFPGQKYLHPPRFG